MSRKKISGAIAILIFILICVATCSAQSKKEAKENKDSVYSIEVKSYETIKAIKNLESEIARLNARRNEFYILILNQTDTTLLPKIAGYPQIYGRRIFFKIKK